MSGPLAGIRVLELGSLIAGPFAGQLLADYGAEVVKIEPPGGGDPMRRWGIVHDGEGIWWSAIARDKQSVAVDLHDARGRELVRALAAQVDVMIENFRPGKLAEWGLDHATLSAANPGLVTVHVSGFGQDGPRARDAGFGSIGEAMGGIRHTTGPADGPSVRCGVSLGDSVTAMFAVIGVLAALHERSHSGRGQEIDAALYESVFALMESTVADYELAGVVRTRSGGTLPGVAPSNVYPTADGREVLIAANADGVFVRLCRAMGRPELADDERFATHVARGRHMAEIDAIVAAWTADLDEQQVLDAMAAHGVPAGRIYTAPDILADPHYQAREMIVRRPDRAGRPVPMSNVVPRFSRTPGVVGRSGPALGEHTDQVLEHLAGLDPATLDRLAADGVIARHDPGPDPDPDGDGDGDGEDRA